MMAVVSSKQKILCEMEDFYGRLYALQSPLYLNPTPVAPSRFSPTLYQRTSRRQHWRNWLSPETEKWRSPKWSRSYNRDLESRGTPVLEQGSFIKRERETRPKTTRIASELHWATSFFQGYRKSVRDGWTSSNHQSRPTFVEDFPDLTEDTGIQSASVSSFCEL